MGVSVNNSNVWKYEYEDEFNEILERVSKETLAKKLFEELLSYEILLLTLEFKYDITPKWRGRTTLKDYSEEEVYKAMNYLLDYKEMVDFALD